MQKNINKIILITCVSLCVFVLVPAQTHSSNSSKEHKSHWSYSGKTGPEYWSEINTAYSLCNNGREQSPVDFGKAELIKLEPIKFDYKNSPLNLINNGHTIQENISNESNLIIDGKKYHLVQFHFHTPGEHTVNGHHYEMELHFVNQDAEGKYAVVGVFFTKGKFNKELQKIIDNLPEKVNKMVKNNSIEIDLENLLPGSRSYYHYTGSLTTPPCSENINWNVFKTPLEASAKQMEALKAVMGSNSRPVQKLYKRIVYEAK